MAECTGLEGARAETEGEPLDANSAVIPGDAEVNDGLIIRFLGDLPGEGRTTRTKARPGSKTSVYDERLRLAAALLGMPVDDLRELLEKNGKP